MRVSEGRRLMRVTLFFSTRNPSPNLPPLGIPKNLKGMKEWLPSAIRLAVLVLAAPAACHAFVVPPVSGRGGVATGATVWGAQGGARLSSPGLLGLRAGGEKLPSSAQEAPVELDGRVLHPGSEGSGWWDARTTAMPVVLPPDASAGRSKWLMFYYGRATDAWNKGHPAFLPTGSSGLAESEDGLRWSRVRGPLDDGAVMHPSLETGAYDEVQLGVTDVLPKEEGGFVMHYLGGSAERISLSTAPGAGPLVGFRMRCLAAESADGLHWQRRPEPVVDVGEPPAWDSNFASWPRALPVDPSNPAGEWLVTYHALQPAEEPRVPGLQRLWALWQQRAPFSPQPRWAAGAAIAGRYGLGPVRKLGKVLEGGGVGAWDERGVGTRHVLHHDGCMFMLYEGVDASGVHAIGPARSVCVRARVRLHASRVHACVRVCAACMPAFWLASSRISGQTEMYACAPPTQDWRARGMVGGPG